MSWVSIFRLALVQMSLGAIVVLTTSTLNRLMAVELMLPALVPGLLVGLHHAVQMTRPRMGFGSDMGGRRTPWIAGDWLFAVTDDAKVMAIARNTGKIRWINQLPGFENMKSKRGPISYAGPVLAGGRLILAGRNGVIVNVDPATGAFQSQTNVGAPVSQELSVAGSTLYVLDDRGRLHAYR